MNRSVGKSRAALVREGPKRRDDGFDLAGFNQPIPEAVAA
jgi:hypothetical protein